MENKVPRMNFQAPLTATQVRGAREPWPPAGRTTATIGHRYAAKRNDGIFYRIAPESKGGVKIRIAGAKEPAPSAVEGLKPVAVMRLETQVNTNRQETKFGIWQTV